MDIELAAGRTRLYVVFRPAATTARRLAAENDPPSRAALGELDDEILWIRSYELEDRGGDLATLAIYAAASPEAIRRHSARSRLPVREIVAVASVVDIYPSSPAGTG